MPISDGSPLDTLICPVCRAVQAWSDSCRRCRCDLSLLRQAEHARRRTRQDTLLHLAGGRWTEAQRAALAYHAIQPGPDSRRFLAVCCLLAGQFGEAMEWAGGDQAG